MKDYPSIPASTGTKFREIPGAYVFDKKDGRQLRWEWSKKQGWYKTGTRTRLVDRSEALYAPAFDIFEKEWAESLAKVAVDNRWQNGMVVFTEYWGPGSLAGTFDLDNTYRYITLFDVAANKKGLMGPKEYLKLFGHLPVAEFLGIQNWTRGFVDQVREDKVQGVTFEGVIGKAGEGHKLVMAKAKTQKWIDAILARYTPEEAEKIINS